MTKAAKSGKVGDLMVEAGILTQQDLDEGMEMSSSLGLPIGKTMVMSGVLSEKTVRAAVLMQSMLKDGLLERNMAIQALARACQESRPIEDCLLELGWRPLSDLGGANKVGTLLVEAGVLSKADLKSALEQVDSVGLTLGRILVTTGKVQGSVVWCALNSQLLLREKKISKKQAISAVRAVNERQMSFEQGLREQGLSELLPERRIKLGELLVLSGLVAEEDILGAAEDSVVKDRPLGQVLVENGLISKERLEDALKLQEMTDSKLLSPLQTVDVLRNVNHRGFGINRAIAELGLLKPEQIESMKLGELLKQCGWITQQEIDEAVNLASKNSNLLGKMLVAFGFIDEAMLFSTLRCQFLVREGFIKADEAVVALHFSQRTGCTLDQALVELGYTNRPSNKAPVKADNKP